MIQENYFSRSEVLTAVLIKDSILPRYNVMLRVKHVCMSLLPPFNPSRVFLDYLDCDHGSSNS